MTVAFGLSMNPRQDNRLSNSSGMPIPSIILKVVCSNILSEEMLLNNSD